MSGDWTISGWSRNKDEDKITNEKADTEETKSANVEFTGDQVPIVLSEAN